MESAISLLVPCVIIAVVSVTLMVCVVPPNRVYGFRTRRTLANSKLWIRANRFAGFALFIAAVTSAAIFLGAPEYASGRSLMGVVVLVVPLVVALAASFAYVRRVGDDQDGA